ncbi:hypothetical protein [Geminocystis sp. GBBB08]|nr:hypothetical protein [Geminocystis sp. GBBB08]MBL1208342.1 type II toxin-antitoxin system YoeB family toxin [Geminocystis sp. GBBB08]
MKRKKLEKKLRIAGCYLKREGSSHSPWINPQTGVDDYLTIISCRYHYPE